MGARIESLPIPAVRPGKKGSWLVAAGLALLLAGGAAAYFALQHDEPASGSAAVSSQSGSIAGRGRALARQAALSRASFPSAAALERQAAYGSAALTRPGLGLAELRGVDMVGIGTAGFWARTGAINPSFPSVAAMERQIASVKLFADFGPALPRGMDVVGIGTAGFWARTGAISPSFPSVAALERQAAQAPTLPPTKDCVLIRYGPC
jgi:hypothetical protein